MSPWKETEMFKSNGSEEEEEEEEEDEEKTFEFSKRQVIRLITPRSAGSFAA